MNGDRRLRVLAIGRQNPRAGRGYRCADGPIGDEPPRIGRDDLHAVRRFEIWLVKARKDAFRVSSFKLCVQVDRIIRWIDETVKPLA